MLTTWGKKLCAMANTVGNSGPIIPYPAPGTSGDAMIAAKTVNDEDVYIPNIPEGVSYAFIKNIIPTGSTASTGVAVGSGSTPPTENDNKLEQLITDLTASTTPSVTLYYDKTTWKIHARLDYALSNDTGAAVTISEIGLFRRFYTATTRGDAASSSAKRSILVERTVLAQPVTIPDGGAAVVRYEFAYDT